MVKLPNFSYVLNYTRARCIWLSGEHITFATLLLGLALIVRVWSLNRHGAPCSSLGASRPDDHFALQPAGSTVAYNDSSNTCFLKLLEQFSTNTASLPIYKMASSQHFERFYTPHINIQIHTGSATGLESFIGH